MKQILAICAAIVLFACKSGETGNTPSATGSDAADGDLYLRTYMWTGMYGSNLDISWIYLDEDGNIVRNPKHGVNPVDWAKEKQDNAKNTGTYKLQGDKLEISWSDGKTASWGIEKEKGKFSIIDGGITTIQDPMPQDYRIEGQYASSVVLPNVASSHTIVFGKDGSFSSGRLGTVTTPDVTGSSSSEAKGTYDISGNTLTMKFSDGRVEKSVIAIWDMDGQKNLVINGSYYPQEK